MSLFCHRDLSDECLFTLTNSILSSRYGVRDLVPLLPKICFGLA